MAVNEIPTVQRPSVAFTATLARTSYATAINLSSGVYFVSCVPSSVAVVDFIGVDGSLAGSVTTSNGSGVAVATQSVARIMFWTNAGANVQIAVTRTGAAAFTGTASTALVTITTSGPWTPPAVGYAKVCLIGGGGGGGNGSVAFGGPNTGGAGGGGGGSGNATFGAVILTASTISVSLGAGGSGAGTGGTTTFGSLSALGGSPGVAVTGGAGGSGGGGAGIYNAPGLQGATDGATPTTANPGAGSGVSIAQFVTAGVGGAGGAQGAGAGQTGTAGGIYAGGGGGGGATNLNIAPGGAGGGGGGGVGGSGQTGGAGRVFVLRWV